MLIAVILRVLVIAAKVPAGQDDCATDLTATLINWVPATADITLTFRSPYRAADAAGPRTASRCAGQAVNPGAPARTSGLATAQKLWT
jgi:hypothetical protein